MAKITHKEIIQALAAGGIIKFFLGHGQNRDFATLVLGGEVRKIDTLWISELSANGQISLFDRVPGNTYTQMLYSITEAARKDWEAPIMGITPAVAEGDELARYEAMSAPEKKAYRAKLRKAGKSIREL